MRLQLQMRTVASLTKREGPSAHVWAKMIAPLSLRIKVQKLWTTTR